MILINRTVKTDIKAALEKLGRDGLTERARSIGHFTLGDPSRKPTFKAYKDQLVKDELNALFKNKCAYCESEYEHVSPMDVEHFRPKGAYILPDGKKSKKGYFWLAAEWTNLLPSCIDCNRQRKQFRRNSDGLIIKSLSGKANKFPIVDENNRAQNPDDEVNETALLLDPCKDKPSQYLDFLVDGSVRPKNGSKEKKFAKGQYSIEVYGLDREGLVRVRKEIMKRLKSQMQNICSYTLNVNESPGIARHIDDLKRAKKEMKNFATKASTYLALVKPMIRSFNRALKLSVEYLEIKERLLVDSNNYAIQQELLDKLKKIKRSAVGTKPTSIIVNLVVDDWMALLEN